MIPNLIHPVDITIHQIDNSNTLQDDGYREPIQDAARKDPVVCPGQVKWGSNLTSGGSRAQDMSRSGDVPGADGYVVFRTIDLRARGVLAIQLNDRFVSFGAGANQQMVDVYVVKIEPFGHYTDIAGAGLIKAHFKDRTPVKPAPE